MNIFILVIALVGSHGSSIEHIEFSSLKSCNEASNTLVKTLKSGGAPGWVGNSGVRVTAVCLEK